MSNDRLHHPFYRIRVYAVTSLRVKHYENIVVKEENAGNQHFLLLPQCFIVFDCKTLEIELYLIRRAHLQAFSLGQSRGKMYAYSSIETLMSTNILSRIMKDLNIVGLPYPAELKLFTFIHKHT